MQTEKHINENDLLEKRAIGNAMVFISYSRKDGEEFAKDLRGVLGCDEGLSYSVSIVFRCHFDFRKFYYVKTQLCFH